MTLELILGKPRDLELVLPLVCAYHEFEGIDSTESRRKSAVGRLLGSANLGGIWLIQSGGTLCGYIVLCRGFSIEFDGFDAFVDEFYLLPEYRGRGIGGRVLKEIKSKARALDINSLHLEVARDNDRARRLYRAAGFEARDRYLLMSATLERK